MASPHYESFEPPREHLALYVEEQQQEQDSNKDLWHPQSHNPLQHQQQQHHHNLSSQDQAPRAVTQQHQQQQSSVDRVQEKGQRLYERTPSFTMSPPDVGADRSLSLSSPAQAPIGSRKAPSVSTPPVRRNYQSELFESIDFAPPPVASPSPSSSSNSERGYSTGPSSGGYDYSQW
jgi:hypothetical protein